MKKEITYLRKMWAGAKHVNKVNFIDVFGKDRGTYLWEVYEYKRKGRDILSFIFDDLTPDDVNKFIPTLLYVAKTCPNVIMLTSNNVSLDSAKHAWNWYKTNHPDFYSYLRSRDVAYVIDIALKAMEEQQFIQILRDFVVTCILKK